MVGFGSSLRMGRRTGWESAYLDYETLKMLLSQIEAVYEERDLTGVSADGFFIGGSMPLGIAESERNDVNRNHNNGTAANSSEKPNKQTTDYRDELFLEWDSDIAFASEMDVGDDDESDSDSEDYEYNYDYEYDYDYYADRDLDTIPDDSIEYNYTGSTVWEQHGLGQHHMHVDPYQYSKPLPGSGVSEPTPSAFSVSAYATTKNSGIYGSSSSDDDNNDQCDYDYSKPWATTKRKKKDRTPKKKKSKASNSLIHPIIGGGKATTTKKKKKRSIPGFHQKTSSHNTLPDAFIVEKGSIGGDYHYGDDAHPDGGEGKNYYYYNFGGNDESGKPGSTLRTTDRHRDDSTGTSKVGGDEDSALLSNGFPTPQKNPDRGNFVWFPSPSTATKGGDAAAATKFRSTADTSGYGSLLHVKPIASSSSSSQPQGSSSAAKTKPGTNVNRNRNRNRKPRDERKLRYERERRRQRKQRRRRNRIRQRKEREKRVPPHIRVAHEKSRAITERFLGLLRAEVEKVTLFAQARLGELADTAGSLRFLSSDENLGTSGRNDPAYDYPLSEGGIHLSASSSSDEGAGGYHNPNYKGGFPWSDSSTNHSDVTGAVGGGRRNTTTTFSPTDTYSVRNEPNRSNPSLSPTPSSSTPPPATHKGWTSPAERPAFTETQEKFEATKRKIAQFQEVRRERSIFQRNDYIVGEDLLLVSAVDEADAFSAVGVELLHILKYICVNLIAVRKICKKHDRLLMNRMLGGYYHRKKTTRSQEETTLGGLIAHVAGDIYEAHPDLIGLVNNGKLIGVYDLKIQQLANSRTVKVVSSCLALALSEYEVSRWRADALAKLNPALKKGRKPSPFADLDQGNTAWPFKIRTDNCLKTSSSQQQHEADLTFLQGHDICVGSDDEHGAGPPSTTSALSLSRLRYTVLSIAALREASRIKSNNFSNYLSRSTLTFTGHAIIGEGLDGCSRDTLNVVLSYNPDAALLLDTSAIYEGLRCGQWRRASIASVMTSALAVALNLPHTSQSLGPLTLSPRAVHEKELIVSNALSILPPKSKGLVRESPLEGTGLPPSIFLRISRFTDIPVSVLRANRLALFLYNANFFIAHPTSVTFVLDSDESIAYSALVIGAPTLSAIMISMIHCRILSGYSTRKVSNKENINLFRYLLIFSSLSAIAGNAVQVYAIENQSIGLSILGRFLLGFAAAEIVNRQFVVCFLPTFLIVAESARLVQFQVSGQILGLLIGSFAGGSIQTTAELNLELLSVVNQNTDARPGRRAEEDMNLNATASHDEIDPNFEPKENQVCLLTAANWCMIALWLIYLVYMLFGWGVSDSELDAKEGTNEADYGDSARDGYDQEDSSSESFESDEDTNILDYSSKLRVISADRNFPECDLPESPGDSNARLKPKGQHRKHFRRIRTFTKNFRKLMIYSIAIPVSLVVIVCSVFAQEVLFSTCALITKCYFHWRGSASGIFLASLSVTLLPMDYCCERITRRYEERFLVKRSIMVLGLGLLVIVNWGSFFALMPNLNNLFKEDRSNRHHQYDWMLGVGQYVVGFIITFSALRALGIGSRSLLSKVSPPNLQNIVVNLGTITTFITLFSQFFAYCYISSIVLSQREINIDILNSLLMPISITACLMYYLVRKHYFFLM